MYVSICYVRHRFPWHVCQCIVQCILLRLSFLFYIVSVVAVLGCEAFKQQALPSSGNTDVFAASRHERYPPW